MVNYDLIDKVREAKTGFSLHKYVKTVGLVNGVMIPTMLLGAQIGGVPIVELTDDILRNFGYSLWCNLWISFGYSFFRKDMAIEQLRELSTKLNSICIETSPELLKGVYQYDVEYNVCFDSFPPKIVQNKYMMVPVNNYWENNERAVKQEHVIGTRDYELSYGEPVKKKSYSYARRRLV